MKTISTIILIILGLTSVFAQNSGKPTLTDEEINELSAKLAMKLLMNDAQKASTVNLLKSLRTDVEKMKSVSEETTNKDKEAIISSINSQIEALLDSKQKMKFSVLQKEWWASVDEELKD